MMEHEEQYRNAAEEAAGEAVLEPESDHFFETAEFMEMEERWRRCVAGGRGGQTPHEEMAGPTRRQGCHAAATPSHPRLPTCRCPAPIFN